MSKFRTAFSIAKKQDLTKWFPGHMHKGMKQMQQKLRTVDCIVEVHDARIPFSGRNPDFHQTLTAIKPHILVLNKMDLSDLTYRSDIEMKLKEQGIQNLIFAHCKNNYDKGVAKVVPTIVDLVKNSDRYHRAESPEFCVMIIGVPNVGKSSLINAMRGRFLKKAKATRVGAIPGVTRSVLEKIKISEDPLIYLLDTPGILTPKAQNLEIGLRLALCATLQDHLVGEDLIADYLLYWLNEHENFKYVEYLGLSEPYDDIREVLVHTAVNLNRTVKYRSPEGSLLRIPNFKLAACHFIRSFREGKLGNILLDDDFLKGPNG